MISPTVDYLCLNDITDLRMNSFDNLVLQRNIDRFEARKDALKDLFFPL